MSLNFNSKIITYALFEMFIFQTFFFKKKNLFQIVIYIFVNFAIVCSCSFPSSVLYHRTYDFAVNLAEKLP